MKRNHFRVEFILLLLQLFPFRVFSQLQSNEPSLQVQDMLHVKNYAVRVARNPMDNALYYCTFFGGQIYKVVESSGNCSDTLVASESNHYINFLQGMLFNGNKIYLAGNRKISGQPGYGLLMRGTWQPAGNWTWDTLMRTVPYPSSATLYDHAFSSLCLSDDGNYIYIGSGARTDHGEAHSWDAAYPTTREVALTSAIFRIPLSAPQMITLPNDSASLQASGYVFARGVRNSFDLALAPNGDLLGTENSGDRDDADELNWLRQGYHYGFPWKMGGNMTGQQYSNYNPNNDKLINHNCLGWTHNPKYFFNDPSYPPLPGNVTFAEPVKNFGPDADRYRSAANGSVHDASNEQSYISSFTPHRAPLGLVFDRQGLLAAPYGYSGFVLGYTQGSADTTGVVNGNNGPFSDTGEDLLQLCLKKDTGTSEYTMQVYRLLWDFDKPVDAWLEGNQMYVIESNEPNQDPAHLYRITFPADTLTNGIVFLPADTSICQGSSVTIVPKLKGSFDYLWSNGKTTSQLTVTPTGTKKFWLRISNGIITITDTIKVIVLPLPDATITAGGTTTFCSGSNVQLNAVAATNRSYQWRKNGVDIPGATLTTWNANATGTYKVRVTNTNTGCNRLSPAGIVVTVHSNPQASVTAGGPVSFCQGDSVKLTANSGTSLTYKWKRNGLFISGATAIHYTVKIQGTYKVEVTNSNNCKTLSPGLAVTVNCRDENQQPVAGISVSPNPSQGKFLLENNTRTSLTIRIYDLTGRELPTNARNRNNGSIEFSVDQNGIFQLVATGDDGSMFFEKIVVTGD